MPGLMLSAMFVGYIVVRAIISRLAPAEPLEAGPGGLARWRPFFVHVLPLLAIFGLVVGAMAAGWATPTEAAALGAAGAIVAAAAYRALTVSNLMLALKGTVAISGTILFIIIGATTFAQVLSFSGAVNGIVGLVAGQGLSTMTIIVGMMLILLFLGCFVDQVSMMLITLPFFMPLIQKLGVDPVWFGVLFLICMQLGLLTPPFGLLLFTMKGVAPPSISMQEIYAARDAVRRVRPPGAGADPVLSGDRDVAAGADAVAGSRPRLRRHRTPHQQAALDQRDQPVDQDHEGGEHEHPGEHAGDVEHAFRLLDDVASPAAEPRYSPTTAPTTAKPTEVCSEENIHDSADGQ